MGYYKKMSTAQKIAEIEAEMARTQKNKSTMGHLCLLKAKLAKYKKEVLDAATKASGGGGGEGFDVGKTGDARVGLIGFPSVGKSTLMSILTGTYSEVSEHEFTTLTCIPGVYKYKGTKVQLLDLPGIIEGAKDGKGRGKQVIGVARTCSLIMIVLDASKPLTHKFKIEYELEGFGIRLNKKAPDIKVHKKDKGGVIITKMVPLTKLDDDTIKSVLKEYRIMSCDIVLRCDPSVDELIDVIQGNRIYMPCIYILNKIDKLYIEELNILEKVPHYVCVNAKSKWNLDELVERIWRKLNVIRVYTKPRKQLPDFTAPVILKRTHCSVEDFCRNIHKSMVEQFKSAYVWGKSVKHNPQRVGKDHLLMDEDVIQVNKK